MTELPMVLVGLLVCFLIGSIPFAVVAMLGSGIDIRRVGSGNPGFNNVLRVSRARAVVALIGDLGKGPLAIGLVHHFWPSQAGMGGVTLGWLCGFAAVFGHCYSPLLKFKGGKGIATSGGVMLVLYPAWAVIALGLFAAIRIAGSQAKWPEAGMIASLSAWLIFTALMLAFVSLQDGAFAALMTVFLAWRHKKNFQNLLAPA